MAYTITRERDPDAKERICRAVLESLPDWFGIPEAIDQFCREARDLRMWVARTRNTMGDVEVAGLVTLLQHFPTAAELHLIAIRTEHHREGLGQKLLAEVEAHLRKKAARILTVKTLAASAGDRFYARTHRFYAAEGFVPLEVFPTLWNEENPCLLMAKVLRVPRRFSEQKLVIASHNKGKLKEMVELMAPLGVAVVLAGDLGLPEPEETEDSYIGNAKLKAQAAAKASGLPALADDSGLSVAALDGQPGLYTADWEGPRRDAMVGMKRIQDELAKRKVPDTDAARGATFHCVLALAWPDEHVELVHGTLDGRIVWPPRGSGGHGYDPCFQPKGDTRTTAEMTDAEKNAISHRGRAFRRLVEACFK
jgi:XTP/dITP diphosphohydrolase